MLTQLLISLYYAVKIYIWILIARCLLSWFPNVEWYKQPFKALNALTEPLMAPFRRLIPPIGGMDLSPIILFFALSLLQQALAMLINGSL